MNQKTIGYPKTPVLSWARGTGGDSLAWLCLCAWVWSADAAIPPQPTAGDYFHDLAAIVNMDDAQKIRNLQQEIFRQADVPIVVVTVNRMQDYDPGSPGIESFARRWFDTWGIGSPIQSKGMLVMVSRGDRKARIELGAGWGGRFDDFCQRLMDKQMVPQFKGGNYGKGLVDAVASLGEIAKAGPRAQPPGPGLTERVLEHPVMVFNRESNPIAKQGGSSVMLLMVVAGLGCLVAALLLPQYRKGLLIAGFALIGFALLFWIAVVVFALLNRSRLGSGRTWSSSHDWSGGGGGGGGGFGGGSSGGGGASGSW